MGYTYSTSKMHLSSYRTDNVRTRGQFPKLLTSNKVVNANPRRPRFGASRLRASLDEDSTNDPTEIERQKLMKLLESPSISGSELRELILDKFNREYDCRLTRRGKRMYLQIFWKFLGQRSFPLTEEEYQLQLDAVAEYLTMWGVADIVREGIKAAKYAPGHTIGGGARAFSIPLGVDVGENGRSNEWNSF
ncbi:hypothetical protein Ndes2526B_g08915 [Nannochloris sp. 'desiccata']|nr:hypothetical protein KSW81_001525 [Chlorella desiccata (nom. nud.)]KAH7616810.1 hypothetical protein NADE_001618 [Chlorella desiccata (nom. nud.)]